MVDPGPELRFERKRVAVRIYLSGLFVLAIFALCWRVLHEVSPWYRLVSNELIAGLLTIVSVLLAPFVLGSVVEFGLRPLFGRWHRWTDVLELEDRFVSEFSRQRGGRKVVLITHDVGQGQRLASDVTFMHQGRIVESAPAAQFFHHPRSDAAHAFLEGRIVL